MREAVKEQGVRKIPPALNKCYRSVTTISSLVKEKKGSV